MTRTLSVSRKWFSLKGEVHFTDDQGAPAYHAVGEFGPLVPTWTLTRHGEVVARVRKKPWSWSPVWDVEGELGSFQIHRKRLSWTRQYRAVGGPLDGATAVGSLSDLKLEIKRGDEVLARASGELLSLQDRHRVEILGGPEPFVAITLLVLLMDRAQESASMVN